MSITNQLPTPKYIETIRGVPCITLTEHEHLMRDYAQATQAEVTDEQILSLDCVSIDSDEHGTSFWVDRSTVIKFARAILALRPQAVPMTDEPVRQAPSVWNSIQIASWIGSQLMREPSMFERNAVCKFVRSLGRHPTLLKHSPKDAHPASGVPDGVATLRRKMPPLCYVNTTTLDMAIGFWNAEIPDLYEAVYPEAYVDELLRERNNAEKREYEVLGRANALEAELKAMQEKHDAMTPNQ